jgi:predicted transcriptional regulator
MSIRPEFSERILSGDKRVEFRKRRVGPHVTHVLIYSTTPVAQIVGFFEVERQDVARPQALWRRYSSVAGIDRLAFESYFADCEQGVAIRIGRVFRLNRPQPLVGYFEAQPPQSFKYVHRGLIQRLARGGVVETSG